MSYFPGTDSLELQPHAQSHQRKLRSNSTDDVTHAFTRNPTRVIHRTNQRNVKSYLEKAGRKWRNQTSLHQELRTSSGDPNRKTMPTKSLSETNVNQTNPSYASSEEGSQLSLDMYSMDMYNQITNVHSTPDFHPLDRLDQEEIFHHPL